MGVTSLLRESELNEMDMRNVTEITALVGRERVNGKEYVIIANRDTGEVLDEFWNTRTKKPLGRPPKKPKDDFVKVYTRNWSYVVKKKKLSLNEAGFFFSLLAFLDWESNFLVNPETGGNTSGREIAKVLGMDQDDVNEYMERLNKKGLVAIVKLGHGRPNHFILNTNLVFRGKHMKNLSEHERFNDSPLELPVVVKYTERSEKRD